MTKFLTVKEAAQLTGKSPSSIRRIIYPILEDSRHPDRHHIEPDVATAKALRIKGENFAWKVSEELLRREVPADAVRPAADPKSAARVASDPSAAALLEILRKQLDIKDQQIATQSELIRGMSERLREGNILIGTLQQQLSPPKSPASDQKDAVVADAPPAREQGSAPTKAQGMLRKILHYKIF